MALQEGDSVYCLVKTHAFCYVAEMEMASPRQVMSFVDTISVEQAVTGD